MPEFIAGLGRRVVSVSVPLGVGLFIFLTGSLLFSQQGKGLKVTIGARDVVYCSNAATGEDGKALGSALKSAGYFTDSGAEVMLSKGVGGTVVSFAARDDAWKSQDAVYGFEGIGLRIAPSLGGFPIEVRLMDADGMVHKEITVGKLTVGAKDELYYVGAATRADAEALARALKASKFFTDVGAKVLFSKEDGRAISFIVNKNAWERPDFFAVFQDIVRSAAPSVGGLPITLRLLDADMQPHKEVAVK